MLTLDEGGFELSTGLATRRLPWSDCYGFRAGGLIVFGAVYFERRSRGADQALLNQFAIGTEELCAVLSEWQSAHGGVVAGVA
jgi:hypothetical protein